MASLLSPSFYLRFKSRYCERIWGGRRLFDEFGRTIDPACNGHLDTTHVGESWELVDRPDATSCVANLGEDVHIDEVLRVHGPRILGPAYRQGDRFPILVKLLDCADTLSIQVHPNEEAARLYGGEQKSEFWYVLHSDHAAKLYVGLKKGMSETLFYSRCVSGQLKNSLNTLHTHPGDAVYIPSGTLHAIGRGHVILEIQQNSDSTYRMYDWDRVTSDGEGRELHLKEAFASICFDHEIEVKRFHDGAVLTDNQHFRIRAVECRMGDVVVFGVDDQPQLLHLTQGLLHDNEGNPVRAIETVLIPYGKSVRFSVQQDSQILITDNFMRHKKEGRYEQGTKGNSGY
jgi:mannose-6-phosphate isomerase